jgi:hypothetical protein
MSTYGAFATRIGLLQRSIHLIDLNVRNSTGVSYYRLWGAKTLNDAYGNLAGSGVGGTGTVSMMEAKAGQTVRSRSVVARTVGLEEVRRGTTSFQFDINDFITPVLPPPFGSDDDYLFVRLQEKHDTAGWLTVPAGPNAGIPIQGPILVIPTAQNIAMLGSVITLGGLAPAGTGCTLGNKPVFDMTVNNPLPLYLAFPRTARTIRVRNLDTSINLLVSYDIGAPMVCVKPNESSALVGATAISELVVASTGTAIPFSVEIMSGIFGTQ